MTPRTFGAAPWAYLLLDSAGALVAYADSDHLVDMLRAASRRAPGWEAVRIADGATLAIGRPRIDTAALARWGGDEAVGTVAA